MAVKPAEDKSLEGPVAANGVSTVNRDDDGKDVEIVLTAHYTDADGESHVPGDKIKVRPSEVQAFQTSGYAARER